MTIPAPRIFLNAQAIPYENVLSRLKATDTSARIDLIQSQTEDAQIINSVLVWSGTLTNQQIETALSTAQTQAEIDALTRKAAARVGGLSISQLGTATPAQIETYVTTQITNNVAQATAQAAVNNISTTNLATAVGQIKTILTGLVNAQYATKDLLILVGKILVYIRDEIWEN